MTREDLELFEAALERRSQLIADNAGLLGFTPDEMTVFERRIVERWMKKYLAFTLEIMSGCMGWAEGKVVLDNGVIIAIDELALVMEERRKAAKKARRKAAKEAKRAIVV